MTVTVAAVMRPSHRAARVTAAPAAVLTSLSCEICDSTFPVQTQAPARSCRVVTVRRQMGVRWMQTGRLACCRARSCSFIPCCSVMMAPRVLAICCSCCWSVSWNSFIRWASTRCTTWLRCTSLVVLWWSMVTMSCSKDICSSRRAAGVAAQALSSAATSSGGAMFS